MATVTFSRTLPVRRKRPKKPVPVLSPSAGGTASPTTGKVTQFKDGEKVGTQYFISGKEVVKTVSDKDEEQVVKSDIPEGSKVTFKYGERGREELRSTPEGISRTEFRRDTTSPQEPQEEPSRFTGGTGVISETQDRGLFGIPGWLTKQRSELTQKKAEGEVGAGLGLMALGTASLPIGFAYAATQPFQTISNVATAAGDPVGTYQGIRESARETPPEFLVGEVVGMYGLFGGTGYALKKVETLSGLPKTTTRVAGVQQTTTPTRTVTDVALVGRTQRLFGTQESVGVMRTVSHIKPSKTSQTLMSDSMTFGGVGTKGGVSFPLGREVSRTQQVQAIQKSFSVPVGDKSFKQFGFGRVAVGKDLLAKPGKARRDWFMGVGGGTQTEGPTFLFGKTGIVKEGNIMKQFRSGYGGFIWKKKKPPETDIFNVIGGGTKTPLSKSFSVSQPQEVLKSVSTFETTISKPASKTTRITPLPLQKQTPITSQVQQPIQTTSTSQKQTQKTIPFQTTIQKQVGKQRSSPLQTQFNIQSPKQTQKYILGSMQTSKQTQKQRALLEPFNLFSGSTFVPPPKIPKFPIISLSPKLDFYEGPKTRVTKGRGFHYQPSLAAIALDIEAPKPPKELTMTGLFLRPKRPRKKKKGGKK